MSLLPGSFSSSIGNVSRAVPVSMWSWGWELAVLCCAVAPDEQVFPTGFSSTPRNVIGMEEVEKLASLWDFPMSEERHAAM